MTTTSCTFRPPSTDAWLYAVGVHVVTCCVGGAVPVGILLYHAVKSRRLRGDDASITIRRFVAVAVGITVAVGVAVYRDALTTNLVVPVPPPDPEMMWMGRFLLSTFAFSTFFKSLQVAYRWYPTGIGDDGGSLYRWLLWFVLLPEPVLSVNRIPVGGGNDGLVKATRQQTVERIRNLVIKMVALGALVSCVGASSHPVDTLLLPRGPLWLWTLLPSWVLTALDGYVHIWILYLWAATCLDISAVAVMVLLGVAVHPGFANPLLASRTLREAWGTRWNVPVQVLLKRTVYAPCRRRHWSVTVSTLLTFAVSGLLHEYNFTLHNGVRYAPRHVGAATAFFLIMGGCMLLEDVLWDRCAPTPRVQRWIRRLPTPVVSTALTLIWAAYPFERYFFPSWQEAGLMEVIARLLPTVQCP